MAGLNKNVIFFMSGSSLEDNYTETAVTANSMNEANIIQDNNNGYPVKCIDFSTSGGFLSMKIDSSFLQEPFTIDWWEKDANTTLSSTVGLFGNTLASSGGHSFAFLSTSGKRNLANLSSNGSSYFAQDAPIGNVTSNWVHRACIFNGSQYKFFENGILYTTINGTACMNTATSNSDFALGRFRTGTTALGKRIYNFRVMKGIAWEDNFKPSKEVYTEGEKFIEYLDNDSSNEEVTLRLAEAFSYHLKSVNGAGEIANPVEPLKSLTTIPICFSSEVFSTPVLDYKYFMFCKTASNELWKLYFNCDIETLEDNFKVYENAGKYYYSVPSKFLTDYCQAYYTGASNVSNSNARFTKINPTSYFDAKTIEGMYDLDFKLTDKNTNELVYARAVHSDVLDFDNAIKKEKYLINLVSPIPNAPNDYLRRGILINTKFKDTLEQKVTNLDTGAEYKRFLICETWSKWCCLEPSTEESKLTIISKINNLVKQVNKRR